MSRFAGRVVVVTGGGTGIGRAIAARFAGEGARVALCGRDAARLETVARELSAGGATVRAVPLDVRDRAAVERAFDDLVREWRGLHILVNNAGVFVMNPLAEPADPWEDVIATNLSGAYYCARAVARHLSPADDGRIINIASVLAELGAAGYTAYCASKAGMIGLTRALAGELANRKVTVNAILPGWVETSMMEDGLKRLAYGLRATVPEVRAAARNDIPLKRFIRPAEVADLAAHLASPGAGGITAQAIVLDGGESRAG